MYRSTVYNIKAKLVLFKLDCYRFKMIIVIPKVTTKNITKKYKKRNNREHNFKYKKKRKASVNGTL